MAVKTYRPTTPSLRNMATPSFEELTKGKKPEKSLLTTLKHKAGRNNTGKITVRHQGGGNKTKYRIVDFRNAFPADGGSAAKTVTAIEYDPNRTAYLALLTAEDGKKSYVLATDGVKVGDVLYVGPQADIKPGNVLPISAIPVGTMINSIELYPGRGAQLVRSAGAAAQLMAKENGKAQIRLPSGEVRLVRLDCHATIGTIGNLEHENIKIGKAGKKRHMGIRPTVRGSVMNPCDHPHGGGEGRAPVGHPGPMTPWGKPALGLKTRDKKARTNNMIVKRRNDK